MKNFCIAFAIFCVVFMFACVEEESEPIVIGNNVCSYGEYECHDGNSYYCGYPDSSNDVMWIHAETCYNGCDSSTGKCYRNSGSNGGSGDNGSGNNGNNDSSECTSGNFKCVGDESHYCNSNGSWVYDARCEYGCDSSTGKCKTNSGNSEEPSTDLTCVDEGSYRCYDDKLRQQCDSGTWKTVEECDYLCNPTTQQCDDEQGCKSGEYKCIGNLLNYCDNNFWKIKEECQFGCNDSEKKCNDADCTPGEYICGDSAVEGYSYASYYCSNHASWTYNRTCPNACNTSTGKCYEECTSGKYTCSDNNSMYCRDGFWGKNESCTYGGCDPSTGKCKSPECTSGKYKCSNNNSMLCENGFWKNDESCTDGCNESTGKCEVCHTINGKTWSEAVKNKTWEEAKTYCENLVECGYSDWHLPTISELRTLIQNCPATVTGGECGVTDSCLSWDECLNSVCEGCDYDSSNPNKYSKLGDTSWFWSSSVPSDDSAIACFVYFTYGKVSYDGKSYTNSVRCVR